MGVLVENIIVAVGNVDQDQSNCIVKAFNKNCCCLFSPILHAICLCAEAKALRLASNKLVTKAKWSKYHPE